MEAWRTSCPRFPVWEDAIDDEFATGLPFQVTDAGGVEGLPASPVVEHFGEVGDEHVIGIIGCDTDTDVITRAPNQPAIPAHVLPRLPAAG